MSGLGRIHAPDPRDAEFPLRALVPEKLTVTSRVWGIGPNMPLDQGGTPQCVGFSWAGFLYSKPMQRIAHDPDPTTIYEAAQHLDGMALPHEGSTVRAGVQALQSSGHIGSYHWAQNMQDVKDYVLEVGPLVFGTDWLTGMDSPDPQGVLTVSGDVRGGHAYLCRGYHEGLFRFEQSWGQWAKAGSFFIHEDGVNELVFGRGNGEVCSAVEIKK